MTVTQTSLILIKKSNGSNTNKFQAAQFKQKWFLWVHLRKKTMLNRFSKVMTCKLKLFLLKNVVLTVLWQLRMKTSSFTQSRMAINMCLMLFYNKIWHLRTKNKKNFFYTQSSIPMIRWLVIFYNKVWQKNSFLTLSSMTIIWWLMLLLNKEQM